VNINKTFIPDLSAGQIVALISIPEGMANELVDGVDPVFGLYTCTVTTIVASLRASTALMIVTFWV
jgi:SulP family sulfate permease